eukprot:6198559-Pleurochrysis_carterae.AAC.1
MNALCACTQIGSSSAQLSSSANAKFTVHLRAHARAVRAPAFVRARSSSSRARAAFRCCCFKRTPRGRSWRWSMRRGTTSSSGVGKGAWAGACGLTVR